MNDKTGTDTPQIPLARLQAMLLDPSVPDSEIRPYLMVDTATTRPFAPQVRINPDRVEEMMTESALILSSLNNVARFRRQLAYRRRATNPALMRIVSEGDSWFQYPFLLDDVIDQLFDDYAILSLDAAGDLLTDMLSQNELAGAVIAERPRIVLLSAGGNDLLGGGRLTEHLEPFDPGRPALDYLGPSFRAFRAARVADYRTLVGKALEANPSAHVVLHSYAYAIPAAGRWLGLPLASYGIRDAATQQGVVRAIVDDFHAALEGLTDEARFRGRVSLVDGRATVASDEWWDELHPTDEGFAKVAELFRSAIERASATVETALIAPPPSRPGEDVAAAAVAILAAGHADSVLLHELGRRMALVERGVGVEIDLVATESVEGVFDTFVTLGTRILGRVERELYRLVCGTDPADAEDRTKIREALNLGGASAAAYLAGLLTGGIFSLPAAAAAVIAPILVRRFGGAAWEEVCRIWTERLEPATATGAPAVEAAVLEAAPAVEAPARTRRRGGRAAAAPEAPPAPRRALGAPLDAERVEARASRSFQSSARLIDLLGGGGAGMGGLESFGPAIDLSDTRIERSLAAAEEALRSGSGGARRGGRRRGAAKDAASTLVADARNGLQKLQREGRRAVISIGEAAAIEAVVLVDGTRPVLAVSDEGAVATDGVALGDWKAPLDHFRDTIATVTQSVGRIETGRGIVGTGFVIGSDLILTNRHVLEVIAVPDADAEGKWRFLDPDVRIDFGADADNGATKRFAVRKVVRSGPDPINFMIDFHKADYAVLQVEKKAGLPPALTLNASARYETQLGVYAVGYPMRPQTFYGDPSSTPPAAHEHVAVITSLFDNHFGLKRFCPGTLVARPGALADDVHQWITAHDCSTLGGNSGSCIVEFFAMGDRVMGLHFGGQNRKQNWAHALSAFVEDLGGLGVNFA